MRVIDLRCRPAYLHDFFGANPGSPGYATARWLNRRVGTRGSDEHFARSLTPEGFLAEVREAGLSKAVVVGRHTPAQHLPNDVIHQITQAHDELLGIAGIDPALQGVDAALAEIDRAIDSLGYPFRPIRQSIDDFVGLGFKASVLDKLLYGNAAQLFGLPD